MKYNIEKSFFGKTEMEYLGFWVTRDCVKTMDKNRSNKQYDTTVYPEESLWIYRFSKSLSQYVGKTLT